MTTALMNINENTTKTMTSREIAELTNKQHQHVTRDIKKLIEDGAIGASSFGLSSYKSEQNKEIPMYELDFKSTMTLITGYDAKRRAAIINRWIALETGEATPVVHMVQDKPVSMSLIKRETKAAIELAKLYGIEGNQALLSANKAVTTYYGVDGMALLEMSGLVKADKIQYFTPSTLGTKIGVSAIRLNQMLKNAGLQIDERDHKKNIVWNVTDKGKAHCEIVDTRKKHNNGAPVVQIKWAESVLELCPPNGKIMEVA